MLQRLGGPVVGLVRRFRRLRRIERWTEEWGVAVGDDGYFTPTTYHHFFSNREGEPVFPALSSVIGKLGGESPAWVEEIDRLWNDPFVASIPEHQTSETGFFWSNGYFSGDDAVAAAAVVRAKRPATVVEIGCGNSTKMFRQAIAAFSPATRLVSIDPSPRAEIRGLPDELRLKSLMEVELDVFASLAAGDVLFFDGSHLVHPGSDTVHFFLEVLPSLKPGVYVHVHDITLPNDYPAEFLRRRYNEQYLLAVLLMNRDWEVVLPVNFLSRAGKLRKGGVSFWLKRV